MLTRCRLYGGILILLAVGIACAGTRAQGTDEISVLSGQVEQRFSEGKYTEALGLQRTLVVATERMEKASAGAPGIKPQRP